MTKKEKIASFRNTFMLIGLASILCSGLVTMVIPIIDLVSFPVWGKQNSIWTAGRIMLDVGLFLSGFSSAAFALK